jgi:hypothetical protein
MPWGSVGRARDRGGSRLKIALFGGTDQATAVLAAIASAPNQEAIRVGPI